MINNLIRKAKLVYSASPFAEKLIKKISSSGLYSGIVKRRIEKQIVKDRQGPFNLVIETSSFCNARCIVCPYRIMKRPKKIMEKKVFEKIVERIKEEKLPLNKIFFSGMGEPLTDPDLLLRLERVKRLGFPVRLYTNASLLFQETAERLIKLGLDEINISFNGVTPDQYRKVMHLDFKRTMKNIDNFLAIKKKRGAKLPLVQVSLIVTRENEADIDRHVKRWLKKVDSVTVSRPHQWGGGVKIKSKFKFKPSGRVYPCRSLWHTFVIDSQGNFVICCRDYESRYVLGNVLTDSFADIGGKPLLRRFRRLHLSYSPEELPQMCRQCNFPYQAGVEWFIPRSID